MKENNELRKFESKTSATWHLLALAYCIGIANAIRNKLMVFPKIVYPENPARDGFFPFLPIHNWSFLSFLSPVLLLLNWGMTFKSLKDLYYKKNRNYIDYSFAAVNFLASCAWTTLYLIGVAASTYILFQVGPYLVAGIFAMHAFYGLFHFAKDLYHAFRAKTPEARKQHLWSAAKHLLGIVINSLAFTINLLIGIRVTSAINHMSTKLSSMLHTLFLVGHYFTTAMPLIYSLAIVSIAGLAADLLHFNKETWDMFREPKKTFDTSVDDIKKHPWKVIPGFVMLVLRTASLILAPLQLLGYAAYRFVTLPFDNQQEDSLQNIAKDLNAKRAELLEAKNKYYAKNNKENPKLEAKHTLIKNIMTQKLGVGEYSPQEASPEKFNDNVSITALEKESQEISFSVYASFWRAEGETEQLVNRVKKYEENRQSPTTTSNSSRRGS